MVGMDITNQSRIKVFIEFFILNLQCTLQMPLVQDRFNIQVINPKIKNPKASSFNYGLYRVRCNHPKWRAKATTAFLSFQSSEIGIPFPFKSKTFTVSSKLVLSSLADEVSIPVHIQSLMTHQFQNTIQFTIGCGEKNIKISWDFR